MSAELLASSTQLLFAALITGAIYALIAVSLNMIYGTMRLLNVAHGTLVMIGAYLGYFAFTLFGIPPIVTVLGTLLLVGALGALAYLGLFQFVLRRARSVDRLEANSLLVFFGIAMILENVTAYSFTSTPRGYNYLTGLVQIGSATITANRLLTLGVALAAVIAVVLFFRLSIWGLAVRALIQNRDASAIVGINLRTVFVVSSSIGFALAGLAGTLVSMYETVTPFMGVRYTMSAFVIIILGGLGNLTGSLLGGLLLGFLETFGIALTGPNYRSILIYGIFILTLILRPQGLFGSKVRA